MEAHPGTGTSESAEREESSPALSVILPTDRYDTIRETIRHLLSQTASDRLELVIVGPSREDALAADRELSAFRHLQVIESDTVSSLPRARAAGVRAARAPVVVFAETHSFPDPGWAAALIEAHRGRWAAVGPVIANANPGRAASWGNLFVDYGPWVEPLPAGPVDHLPGHNTSYKRSVLSRYGSELDQALEAETIIHWDLRAAGYELYLEPRARTRHENMTRMLPAMLERAHNTRAFATARARDWSALRRAMYAIGSPLLPAIRLRRTLGDVRRAGRRDVLPRALPMMLTSLIGCAIGEMLGYAAGRGDAVRRLSPYELHRKRYVKPGDSQHELAPAGRRAP